MDTFGISNAPTKKSVCGFRTSGRTEGQLRWFSRYGNFVICLEQGVDLYMAFIDLLNSSDIGIHEIFQKIMVKVGCPDMTIADVRRFHDGMLAYVQNDDPQNDGEFSEHFSVTSGVKQSKSFIPAYQFRYHCKQCRFS